MDTNWYSDPLVSAVTFDSGHLSLLFKNGQYYKIIIDLLFKVGTMYGLLIDYVNKYILSSDVNIVTIKVSPQLFCSDEKFGDFGFVWNG